MNKKILIWQVKKNLNIKTKEICLMSDLKWGGGGGRKGAKR